MEIKLNDDVFIVNFFSEIWINGQLSNIVKGSSSQKCQKSDRLINNVVRNELFKNINPGNNGMDLAARNIQRGRDHGLGKVY